MVEDKILLVGSVGCGKTTLRQRLTGQDISYHKTQAVEAFGNVVDSPGEFFDSQRLQNALMVTACDVDTVLILQDPLRESRYPPAFAARFNRAVIGVITKASLASQEQRMNATAALEQAGCPQVFAVDSVTGEGIDALKQAINRS